MDDTQKDQVLAHVDRAAMLDLAKRLISIPSFKPNETPVARFLDDYFRERATRSSFRRLSRVGSKPSPPSRAAAAAGA